MDTSPHKSDFVNVNGIRLHYLDWGGNGPALLFLAGMGCNAHIFDRFAPHFCDKFHVLALTRRGHGESDHPETGYDAGTLTEDLRQFMDALKIEKAILAGHSLGYIELCHFAATYPERLLKLVFLDAAYDCNSAEYRALMEKNPLRQLTPAWPEHGCDTVEDYFAALKRLYPALAVIWGEVLEEQTRHEIQVAADGKVVDKMSDTITNALNLTIAAYVPEYSIIEAPVLSFFALRDGTDYLSSDYMTPEQQAQVLAYFTNQLAAKARKDIDKFRRQAPHARIVEIPHGHHYCFIKHEKLVFHEMRKFLLE